MEFEIYAAITFVQKGANGGVKEIGRKSKDKATIKDTTASMFRYSDNPLCFWLCSCYLQGH